MKLSDYLCESGISMRLSGESKTEILTNLVNVLSNVTRIEHTEKLVTALEEREKLRTTAIGSNIAIPHCKSPDIDKLYIVIGISKTGIDFESLDNEPVNFFFLLTAPEQSGSEHLKASAKIVRLMRKDHNRQRLIELRSPKEVIDYIKAND